MAFFGTKDKLQIIGFQGYGTDSHFYARGRALEDEQIDLELCNKAKGTNTNTKRKTIETLECN